MDTRDYEVEELLLDTSFQNYCLGSNEEDVLYWKTWLSSHPAKKDTVRQARDLYFVLNGNHTESQLAADRQRFQSALQQNLTNEIQPDPAQKTRVAATGTVKRILLYAACAAAVVAALFLLPGQDAKPRNDSLSLQHNLMEVSKIGERKSFQLPDGSKVMLNAGSTIEVSKDFNQDKREISLSGEAFFDVASNPDKPFIIHTSSMDVKVVGTVFNVKAYEEEETSETSLLKGAVEITLHDETKKKILLKPNEKIVLPNVKLARTLPAAPTVGATLKKNIPEFIIVPLAYKKDSILSEVSWTENQLVFNDNDFATISKVLERWYNITIRFADDDIKGYRFTAHFDQKNIAQVLEALQLSREFKFRIAENNNIIISK